MSTGTEEGEAAAVTDADAAFYRACLQHGPLTTEDLARHLRWNHTEVEHQLTRLTRWGLLGESEGMVNALPPRAPLHGLAAVLEDAAVGVRQRASDWEHLWQQYRERAPFIESIEDDKAALAVDEDVVQTARHEVLGLQIGPVGPPSRHPQPRMADGVSAAMARGVRFRVVYGVSLLRNPLALSAVQQSIALGEEARVFPDVPLNLTVSDGRVGLITVPGGSRNRSNMVVVHPSGLLDGLTSLFESYWRMAVPVSADAEPALDHPLDRDSRQLLAYLSAGLTDESISRELGVSQRTVGRRISRLQELLGAQSRFQLGTQAVRHGWI